MLVQHNFKIKMEAILYSPEFFGQMFCFWTMGKEHSTANEGGKLIMVK
jgi:hypothetical protein